MMTLNFNNKLSAFALAAAMTVPALSNTQAGQATKRDKQGEALMACLVESRLSGRGPYSLEVGMDKNAVLMLIPDGQVSLAIVDVNPETAAARGVIKRLPYQGDLGTLPSLTVDQLSPRELSAVKAARGCAKKAMGYAFSLPKAQP